MTTYQYKAVTPEGKLVLGQMEASAERAVIEQLRATGHMPISAAPVGLSLPRIPGFGFVRGAGTPVRRHDVTSFTRELATLLEAGMPMDMSLRTLERHCGNPRLKQIIVAIQEAVRGGTPLSEALARHGSGFDSLYISLVRAGEAAGSIASTLERIADYRERMETFRASIVSSLTYPAILVGVAFVSLFVLTGFVVPRFVPLFADSEAALPVLTRVVFGTSLLVKKIWWLLLLAFCGFALYLQRWLESPTNRRRMDAWLLTLPLLGDLLRDSDTARVSRTIGSLVHSGVPLADSVRLSAPVGQNASFRDALERCRSDLEHGERFSQSLARSNVFPTLAQELIAIGEESGKLEAMLLRTAETFEGRVQAKLKRILVLIEPATILGLGGAIALVIVAVLMAMLKLNTLVT